MTEGGSPYLIETVAYLTAAVVMVPLFVRFKLGAVLGYLAAGILIGPSVLGLLDDPEQTARLAEFGIVLLMFIIGLELKPSRLWAMRRDIFGLGLLQVAACGLALTAVLLVLTSLSWQAALVVGLPLALSSTALVMQLLDERDLTNTPFGQRAFSMLLFQDLAIVPLLTVVAALSRVPDPDAMPGWQQALATVAAIAALIIGGRYFLGPVLRQLAKFGAREAFAAAALLTVLSAALLMASLGLSMALGAFVAGVMLADSPYRHALEADIEPFRGLLMGLFFASVGALLDFSVIREQWLLVIVLVVAVLATKTLVIGLLARAFGSSWLRAFQLGLLLAQGGEFGFVLFASAQRGLLIEPRAAALFSAVVTVTMLLTPLLIRAAARFNPAPPLRADLDGPDAASRDNADAAVGRVLLVGTGRVGQGVAQMLLARGADVLAIDNDPEIIDVSKLFGNRVYFGDGRRVDILRAAGAADAKLLVFAIDGKWDPATVLGPIRAAFPQLQIVARAFDRIHLLDLLRANVGVAVREMFDGSVALGRAALVALDTDAETIDAIEAEYRSRDAERLELQLVSGDQLSGADRLFRPGSVFVPDALGEIPFEEVPAG
ncbi:MAG: monovalent cation:proton antiporter-2 (CPA2) family protein [Polymorphobacter sp.]